MVGKLEKKDPSEMSRDEWCRYWNLNPDESWEDYQREKRNKVIKTIITLVVGVGISAALMFISEDIIASIILGAGFIFFNLATFFRERNLFRYLCFFLANVACACVGSIGLALFFSIFTPLTYTTAFLYCSVIVTLLAITVFWRKKGL